MLKHIHGYIVYIRFDSIRFGLLLLLLGEWGVNISYYKNKTTNIENHIYNYLFFRFGLQSNRIIIIRKFPFVSHRFLYFYFYFSFRLYDILIGIFFVSDTSCKFQLYSPFSRDDSTRLTIDRWISLKLTKTI